MATTYPASKKTFTDPSGTNTLDSPDHAALHTDVNDTVEAIQDTVGTTAGTNVLKDFASGQFPARVNSGGTIVQTLIGGTINNTTLTTPQINDTSSDHQYIFAVSELIADRTVTLPLLTGNDEFVFKDHTQTLTNKTLTSPVINGEITGTSAPYNSSLARQAIINGNFDVWQRGTSVAWGSQIYSADRWTFNFGAVKTGTISRQDGTGVNGSYYCARVQRTAGQTAVAMGFFYGLESQDSIKFRGTKVTLSFYARKGADYSVTTADRLSVAILTGTGTDQKVNLFTNSANVGTLNATLTTSWQKFTVTTSAVIADTVTQIGLSLGSDFTGTAGAADYFEVTQFQLCAGDVALPFQPKSYGDELRACQRYCYVPQADATYSLMGLTGIGQAGNAVSINTVFPITMRSAPTLTATAGDYQVYDGTNLVDVTSIAISSNSASKNGCRLDIGTGGTTQYRPYCLLTDGTASRLMIFNAEL